ncbi:MAG TPA: response regulator [Oceanobacillus sp.]|nr:response regulator [Oceanobacillus sp.]
MSHRILIAEDDFSSRHIYQQVLAGFELVEATDGEQAIERLREQQFDVVILDMLLPRVQGTAVLEFLYQQPNAEKTRVVVITAHSGFNGLALREGDLMLMKPVMPRQIRDAVHSLLVSPTA